MGPRRNAPCTCGSGKKFNHCHGRLEPLVSNISERPTPEPKASLPPFRNAAVTKAKAKVFPPVGRCIYCSDGKPPFTRENIFYRAV